MDNTPPASAPKASDSFAGLGPGGENMWLLVEEVRARCPSLTPNEARIVAVRLRCPYFNEHQIAGQVGLAKSTVCRVLAQNGLTPPLPAPKASDSFAGLGHGGQLATPDRARGRRRWLTEGEALIIAEWLNRPDRGAEALAADTKYAASTVRRVLERNGLKAR